MLPRAIAMALVATLAIGCTASPGEEDLAAAEEELLFFPSPSERAAIDRGERVWFDNTYGGERFFAFLRVHPDPTKRIDVGFRNVLETPRHMRHQVWGTINDPDCEANPAGGPDICDDPEDTGVIGIRRRIQPDGTELFGVACASCHAGIDPTNPPDDVNEPTWDNIHPTIGNQNLELGRVFAANLDPTDPRGLLFASWPAGAVDTTLLFSDNINNPGTITAFWNHPYRPTFEVGRDEEQLRNGQGGEDDFGGDLAALRVYTNIGVCFNECVAPAVATERPISIEECRATCPDFPPQSDLDDLTAFLGSARAPLLRDRWPRWRDYFRGRRVFRRECASCHEDRGLQRFALTNDEVNPLADDPANATNACRALTTNWEEGRLWAEFSSQVYKDRVEAGDRGYRTMPLTGIWSTSPLLHNQSIGPEVPAEATPTQRADAWEAAMWELLSTDRTPVVNVTPIDLPGVPAGTPLAYLFSRDPDTGAVLCDDVVENRGHYYGADLSDRDKRALIEWLRFQ